MNHREGVALLAVITLGVALTLTAHAALLLGRALLTSAHVDASRIVVDAALDVRIAAAHRAILAAGELTTTPGVQTQRLTAELTLLSADSAGRSRGTLLWSADPFVRLLDDSIGLRVGAPVGAATRSRIVSVPPVDDPCPGGIGVSVDLREARPTTGWGSDAPLRFGPLDPADVAATWDELPASVPELPTTAYAGSNQRLGEGVWRGTLSVAGDVVVGPGAVVLGRLAVSGDLTIEAGGVVEGVARVGDRLEVLDGGVLRVAPCSALLAMAAAHGPIVALEPLLAGR